jgi:RNA-directed DNA polymerase
VISPLLANIALSAIEERYERWVHHRRKIRAHRISDGVKAALEARMSDRRRGLPVFFPIRYADDRVPRTHGKRCDAAQEMRVGLSKPAVRRRLQTTASCMGQEPLW